MNLFGAQDGAAIRLQRFGERVRCGMAAGAVHALKGAQHGLFACHASCAGVVVYRCVWSRICLRQMGHMRGMA